MCVWSWVMGHPATHLRSGGWEMCPAMNLFQWRGAVARWWGLVLANGPGMPTLYCGVVPASSCAAESSFLSFGLPEVPSSEYLTPWLAILGSRSRKTSSHALCRRHTLSLQKRRGACLSCSSQRAAFTPYHCTIPFLLRPLFQSHGVLLALRPHCVSVGDSHWPAPYQIHLGGAHPCGII